MQLEEIILIDDDPITNLVNSTLLRKIDLAKQIQSFENPKEAYQVILEKFKTQKIPDLILLDLNMPNISGWDFIKKLYEESCQLCKECHKCYYWKICILTSSIDEEDRTKASQFPHILHYLTKPLKPEELKQVLDSFYHC